METYLYCDGSSTGRSNREWGYGFVVVKNDIIIHQDFGGGPSGTNNYAELFGAINGLIWLIENDYKEKVVLTSDSLYVLNTANGTFKPKKNLELCKQLKLLYNVMCKDTKWVKGHSKEKYNEICDELAKKGKGNFAPTHKK